MQNTTIVSAALFLLSTPQAKASVVTFNDPPAGPSGSSYLGASFIDSDFQFSTDGDFTRYSYDCNIFAGCANQGIKFTNKVTVSRIDGASFDLQGLYIAGGLNYDGAAPAYTPGTIDISGVGSNTNQYVSKYLPNAGFVTTGFTGIKTFSVTYNSTFTSTAPLFDDITFTLSGSSVPEPSAWALFTTGFGIIGDLIRRRLKLNYQAV